MEENKPGGYEKTPPGASDIRILKTPEERKVTGEKESGGEKSRKKQSLREEEIGPSGKLNEETIDSSVKEAMQTIAKYYSMVFKTQVFIHFGKTKKRISQTKGGGCSP